jgi:hypothetical protein
LKQGFLEYCTDRKSRWLPDNVQPSSAALWCGWHPVNGCAQSVSRWFRESCFPEIKISGLALSDLRHTWETSVSLLPLSDHEKRIAAASAGEDWGTGNPNINARCNGEALHYGWLSPRYDAAGIEKVTFL